MELEDAAMLVSQSNADLMESFNQKQAQSTDTNSVHEPHEVYMRLALQLVGPVPEGLGLLC